MDHRQLHGPIKTEHYKVDLYTYVHIWVLLMKIELLSCTYMSITTYICTVAFSRKNSHVHKHKDNTTVITHKKEFVGHKSIIYSPCLQICR